VGAYARGRCEAAAGAEDSAGLVRFDCADDGVRCPATVAYVMADGVAALRAWHEFKGMLLQALADAAGLCKPYLSQIEGGKRTGTSATLKSWHGLWTFPLGL
jgi:hypothetical protein